jgi:hypothetical protein
MSLDKAITIFDTHAKEILSFTANLGGKTEKVYLLDEILYDDNDLVDYQKLHQRLRKLPAVLTFFGTLKDRASASLEEAEDEFKAWYAQAAKEENEKELLRIQQMEVAAGLKKAPTMDQIEGLVRKNRPSEWEAHKKKIRELQERVSILSRMLEGLKASVDLARSEATLVVTLLNQGLEHVNSNGASPFNSKIKE